MRNCHQRHASGTPVPQIFSKILFLDSNLCYTNPVSVFETENYKKAEGIIAMSEYKNNKPRPPRREEGDRRNYKERDNRREQEAEADGRIEGRNAVVEALRAGVALDKVYILKGETDPVMGHIAAKAKESGAVVVDVDRRKLDKMSRTHSHQGVIAEAAVREYAEVEDILAKAAEKGEAPLIVVCDELSDPHNLGAVIRTAECAGAHGVIIPKRRSAGLTATVARTSAGAVAHMLVARVPNLTNTLKDLKKQGVWVFGTAAEGATPLYQADLKGPAAIVIGSEGSGMGRLVSEHCDFNVSIPMKGKLNSLNASAAAAILLYEAVRQRMG
jgi:23S rRNA (guanosine2251-2'-O)-methyltransferase